MTDLEKENESLRTQLQFARQKASLYYIVASELESLKSSCSSPKVVVTKPAETQTDALGVNKECQTYTSSATVEQDIQGIAVRAELDKVRETLNAVERMENKRLLFVKENLSQSELAIEYSELFSEYLKSCQLSVNHSLEIRKRDTMIASLLGNIKLMESTFLKLRDTTSPTSAPSNTGEIAALHSELEDLKAELSKAQTNYAAIRDELVRLQFNRNNTPSPVAPPTNNTPGLISAIRKIL